MRSVLEWLERAEEEQPEKLAFVSDHDALSYAELAQSARKIGSFLAQRQSANTPVALLTHKDAQCVAALLGVVYARGFYCALDERQPPSRLQVIIKTLSPRYVLVDDDYYDQAKEAFADADVCVVTIKEALLQACDTSLLDSVRQEARDSDPLYVNFTSGSTGTPKGVMISHRCVISFITHFTKIFGFTSEDRFANQAPFDFDVSVKDIYSSLSLGATVYLIPREYFSQPTKLMDFLAENKTTVCTWAVSAVCFVSIMSGFDYREVPSIRWLIFSGEVMPLKHLDVWRAHLPQAQCANVYGPTEVTCNCTYYILNAGELSCDPLPIGKPFPHAKVFLLDEEDRLISESDTDTVGEICVAGDGLALGYVNDPARTAAAFVQNPANTKSEERIYRSGDLGAFDSHGNLIYRGRKDHQIKLNGQRIELGEIEATAEKASGVSRACCIFNERKKRIVLYYVGQREKEDLRAHLQKHLPSYMIPAKVFQREELPINKNGKIDRRQLAQEEE